MVGAVLGTIMVAMCFWVSCRPSVAVVACIERGVERRCPCSSGCGAGQAALNAITNYLTLTGHFHHDQATTSDVLRARPWLGSAGAIGFIRPSHGPSSICATGR